MPIVSCPLLFSGDPWQFRPIPFPPTVQILCMQRSKTQVRVTSDLKSSLHLASSQSRDLLLFCDKSHVSFCEAPRLSTGSIMIHNDRPACPRPGPPQASLALVSRLDVGQLHQCQCCHRHPNGQSDPLYGLALVAAPLLRPGHRYYDICRCREDPPTCYHTDSLSRNFRRTTRGPTFLLILGLLSMEKPSSWI
jgi:hypothetical protein